MTPIRVQFGSFVLLLTPFGCEVPENDCRAGYTRNEEGNCVPIPVSTDSGASDDWSPDPDCPAATAPDIGETLVLDAIPPGGGLRALNQGKGEGAGIYAGTETNGVYRLEDEWEDVFSPWAHIHSEIAVNPDDDQIILYGGGTDVYRSENGGLTAEKADDVSATAPEEVWALAFDPGDGDRAYAVRTDGKVYRGIEAGAIWEEVGSISVDPNDKHDNLNQQWRVAPNPSGDGRVAFCCAYDAAMLSADGGVTWTEIQAGPAKARAMFWDSGDPGVLYLGTDEGLQKTDDDGHTWTRAGGPDVPVKYAGQTDDGGTIVSVTADGEVYGNDTLWTALGVEPWALLVTHGEAAPAIMVGTEEQVLMTADGTTWTDATEGMIDKGMSAFGVDPRCASVVWTGSVCSRGMFLSTDYGDTWTHNSEFFHYVMRIAFSPADPEAMWVTSDDWVGRTHDGGETWESVSDGAGNYHFHGVALHPADPEIALLGTTGSGIDADSSAHVYWTDDGGETWTWGGGLPESGAAVYALAWADDDIALLGSYPGDLFHDGEDGFGLYRSTDRGQSWERNYDVAGVNVADVVVEHGVAWAASDAGLYRSDDGGSSFSLVNVTGDAAEEALAVAFRPHDPEVGAVMTGSLVVYLTRDGGATWTELESESALADNDDTSEVDLAFSPDGSTLYVAAPLTGVWRAHVP